MRWNIEVDFRTIKAMLEMDVLGCKTQPMVDKEIAIYFLAYNLRRWAKAALLADVLPRMLTFTGTKHRWMHSPISFVARRTIQCAH